MSGRMGIQSNSRAVSVRLGSITSTRPPRRRTPTNLSRIRGVLIKLPWDTTGFAPTTTSSSTLSMSGMGTARALP